jgi:hypothetical protein
VRERVFHDLMPLKQRLRLKAVLTESLPKLEMREKAFAKEIDGDFLARG